MTWITNKLLLVIMTIWTLWVCAWGRADINSPYLKWFVKCWDAKEKNGGVVWKEFCAIMKYLSLHYTHKHDEAEKHYNYTGLVDMTPFVYRGYAEEDWDALVDQIYMVGGNPQKTPKKSSPKQRKTSSRNQEVESINEPLSVSEQEPIVKDEFEPKQEQTAQIEVEKQPTYEWEEEEKSKMWIWIILALLIAAGAGWYFFKDSGDAKPKENYSTSPVEKPLDTTPVVEEKSNEPTTPLAFLEAFYTGNLNDADYIKQHVTASVLNKLKRAYESDCPSGDCLATWVLSAYPPGYDLELEEGPIITKSKAEGKYSIYYQYYTQGQSGRIYHPAGLLVSVTQIDGKYLMSDYELFLPEGLQSTKELSSNNDGTYYLRDGHMFLTLNKKGKEIEVEFNFRDGTWLSATYTFSCVLDDENHFLSKVHKHNGELSGQIEGTLNEGIMKVDVRVDNKYSGEYELKKNEN